MGHVLEYKETCHNNYIIWWSTNGFKKMQELNKILCDQKRRRNKLTCIEFNLIINTSLLHLCKKKSLHL